jgi:hypothetical protein
MVFSLDLAQIISLLYIKNYPGAWTIFVKLSNVLLEKLG